MSGSHQEQVSHVEGVYVRKVGNCWVAMPLLDCVEGRVRFEAEEAFVHLAGPERAKDIKLGRD